MKKITKLSLVLLGTFSLASCGNKSNEPNIEIEKDPIYEEEYKRIYEDTKTLGEDIEGDKTWVFYTHPLDKEFNKLYEVEFTIIDDLLFGCTYYFENDVYVQSLIVSIPSNKTNEVSFIYNEAEYGDDVDFEGTLNPGTYNNLTKNITFKDNEILKDESKLLVIKDNCGDLINYYLSTVKTFTSYDLIKLGYGSFQG